VSSEGGLGIGDLLDALLRVLPESVPEPDERLASVAIVGRPNVGKSSLVNALLGEERMIVEPEPGTTLDPIDARWDTPKGPFLLVDTAGIRRQARFADQAEFFATMRALHALERAEVACVVVDATQGFLRQEARLVQNAFEAGRPVLLLYNKWDLIAGREQAWKALTADRARRFPTLGDVPAMPVSATVGTHLQRLPEALASRVAEGARKIPTPQLNKWLAEVQRRRAVPSDRLGHVPKIYYMTQTGARPPEFTLFVNAPSRLNEAYRRFLWLSFVERFGFRGTPVRLRVRKSE
jgi:GTP-binding protein